MADKADEEKDAEMTLYYWTAAKSFLGRAIGPIMMVGHAGKVAQTKIEDVPKDDMAKMGCFASPVMKFKDGLAVSQTSAIMETLGVKLGLMPTEEKDIMKARQISMDSGDFVSEFVYKYKDGALPDEFKTKRMAQWLTHFENVMKLNADSKFVCGSTLTYADYQLLIPLEGLACVLGDDYLKEYPKLAEFFGMMKGEAGYKHYLSLGTLIYGGYGRKPAPAAAAE